MDENPAANVTSPLELTQFVREFVFERRVQELTDMLLHRWMIY